MQKILFCCTWITVTFYGFSSTFCPYSAHIPFDCTPPPTQPFSTTSPGTLPYCEKCKDVVKPMCILGEVSKESLGKEEKHKKCYPFVYMDARNFCSKIGAYSICYVIREKKKLVDDCLNGTKTEEKCDNQDQICQTLQLC